MRYLALLLLLLSPATAHAAREEKTPFVALLSSPETYAGRQIYTAGVLGLNSIDGPFLLYLDQGSHRAEVPINAIALAIPEGIDRRQLTEALGRYVLIGGVFDTEPPIPKLYSSSIEVHRVLTYPLLKAP